MGLYAKYTKERDGYETIEIPEGFADYKIFGEECYIRNIYVLPDHRKENIASQLADKIVEIVKPLGCKYLTGSVMPSANGSTVSMKVLLGYGFELLRSESDKIIFIKKIG